MSDASPDSSFAQTVDAAMNAAADSVFASEEASTPAVESAPEPSTPDIPETPVAESALPDAPPDTPTPQSVSDDTPVELTIDGEVVRTTFGEAKKFAMMGGAFTKKTQRLAEERKEAQRLAEESQAKIAEALAFQDRLLQMTKSRKTLAALYMNAEDDDGTEVPQAPPTQAPFDPEQLTQRVSQDVYQRVVQQAEQAQLSAEFTEYTKGLLNEDPILAELSGDYVEIVWRNVAGMQPSSPAEAKQFIKLVVEDASKRIKAKLTDQQKIAAVAKAKDGKVAVRGGAPVPPAPKAYKGFDDPAMEEDILAFVEAQARA